MSLADRISLAVATIQPQLKVTPGIAMILGSGLGGLAHDIDEPIAIDYCDIPYFNKSSAPGHEGKLVFGKLAGQQVICMQGRLHGYEGNSPEEIVFPLMVMHELGAETLIVTNAAGGIKADFEPGDIMLITDHINLTGAHPITLGVEQGIHNFADMTYAYSPRLRDKALKAAKKVELSLKQGVYIGVRGPTFETPAEIRAFRSWGADAVGMSTVFEVITAAALGMETLALSLIANKAAGILDQPLSGDEIVAAAVLAAEDFKALLRATLSDW